MGYSFLSSNNFIFFLFLLLPESLVFTESLNNGGSTKRVSNNCYFIPVDRVLYKTAQYISITVSQAVRIEWFFTF